jgi:predicted lipid-binding transport protein (Tim44 family)
VRSRRRNFDPTHTGGYYRDAGAEGMGALGDVPGLQSVATTLSRFGVPAGFDESHFLAEARRRFVQVQKAWDAGDLDALHGLATTALIGEMRQQLATRPHPDHTELISIDTQLLGIEMMGDRAVATVEYTGLMHDIASGAATPFREVWIFLKDRATDVSATEPWMLDAVEPMTV